MQIKHYRKVHASGVKVVSGKIVDWREKAGMRSRYYPIVEFDVGDKSYRFIYSFDAGDKPSKGKKVDIAYHVHNPHNCFLARDYRGLIIIISTIVVVGILGAFGAYLANQLSLGPLL